MVKSEIDKALAKAQKKPPKKNPKKATKKAPKKATTTPSAIKTLLDKYEKEIAEYKAEIAWRKKKDTLVKLKLAEATKANNMKG